MNKRIQELAEQARASIPPGLVVEEWIKIYNQVLGELIVQECCIALNPMLRDMISRGQGVDIIKLHFGMNPKEITAAMLDTAIEQCEQELAKKKSGVENETVS